MSRALPLRNEKGNLVRWFGTHTDVTERRGAREALAISEQRLSLALEAGKLGIFEWDLRTGEVVWSDTMKRIFAFAPDGFRDMADFLSRVHPNDLPFIKTLQDSMGFLSHPNRLHSLSRLKSPPRTASPLPLLGLIGLIATSLGIGIPVLRRD